MWAKTSALNEEAIAVISVKCSLVKRKCAILLPWWVGGNRCLWIILNYKLWTNWWTFHVFFILFCFKFIHFCEIVPAEVNWSRVKSYRKCVVQTVLQNDNVRRMFSLKTEGHCVADIMTMWPKDDVTSLSLGPIWPSWLWRTNWHYFAHPVFFGSRSTVSKVCSLWGYAVANCHNFIVEPTVPTLHFYPSSPIIVILKILRVRASREWNLLFQYFLKDTEICKTY